MTDTDPLTDFTQLIPETISINQQISLENSNKTDEYLKELELNNFQTRQLFDELLEEEYSPQFISSFQKNQNNVSTFLQMSDQQNVTSITDVPHLACIEVQKTRKIMKQKKIPQNSSHQKSHLGLVSRETQRPMSKLTHNRLRFRIQQNDQQQKLIQTTQSKRKNGGKINEFQSQAVNRNTSQSCTQPGCQGKLFNCEQFQNYLNLS